MQVVLKTFGWLIVSGAIIFTSNIASGVEWKTALYGAAIAKIGTTIAYFFYELFCQRLANRKEGKTETVEVKNYTYNPPVQLVEKSAPCV